MTEESIVRVVGGNPTEEELAAILAVVGEHYATESASATVDDRPRSTGWTHSRRLRRYRRQPWGRFRG